MEYLGLFLGKRIVFFFSVMILTFVSFSMAEALSGKKLKHFGLGCMGYGIFNGFMATFTILKTQYNLVPIMLLLITTTLLFLEFMTLSRESLFFFAMIVSGFLMIISCMYSLAVVLSGSFDIGVSLILRASDTMALDTLVIIFTSAYFIFLRFGRLVNFNSMMKLFHYSDDGKLSLMFYLITDFFILASMHYTVKLAYEHTLNEVDMGYYMMAMLFRDMLVLILSLLVLFFQTREIGGREVNLQLSSKLHKEESLRRAEKDAVIFSFSVDVVSGDIRDGKESFNWDVLDQVITESKGENGDQDSDNARLEVLSSIVNYCCHPDDAEDCRDHFYLSHFMDKLHTDPTYTMRVRISPRRVLESMFLTGKAICAIREHENDYFWCDIRVALVDDKNTGELILFVEISDIDAEVTEEQKLMRSATTDGLTGTLNRATLTKRIEDLTELHDTTGGLYIVDIDNFKTVNDTYGHQTGDAVIKGIAEALKNTFRRADIVGRLGGDEFMVFAVGLHDSDVALRKAELLREACHHVVPGSDIRTSVSIGIAMFPRDAETYKELYKCADSVLYEVKENGRDGFDIFN